LRTWIEASDDCCARGGHLVTLLLIKSFLEVVDSVIRKGIPCQYYALCHHIQIRIFVKSKGNFWVGAMNTLGTTDAVWCVPGENNVSTKSPLSGVKTLKIFFFKWIQIKTEF
jgi:hypothetical protein